jgi:hypothetical protein
MSSAIAPKNSNTDWTKVRMEWIARLDLLVNDIEQWAQEIGWSTKRIEKRLDDRDIGVYQAPALLMQENFTRVLLDPITLYARGTDGEVDLYRMPAYDDIARLFYSEHGWQMFDASTPDMTQADGKPVSKESVQAFLQGLRKDGT